MLTPCEPGLKGGRLHFPFGRRIKTGKHVRKIVIDAAFGQTAMLTGERQRGVGEVTKELVTQRAFR